MELKNDSEVKYYVGKHLRKVRFCSEYRKDTEFFLEVGEITSMNENVVLHSIPKVDIIEIKKQAPSNTKPKRREIVNKITGF